MTRKRTSMTNIKEILRLKHECHLSTRQIASCLNIGRSTVSDVLTRFKQSDYYWPLASDVSDTDLSKALYQEKPANRLKVMPDFAYCFIELKRKGATKQLLWEEYVAEHQERTYGYSQFCEYFRRWLATQKRSMRQLHTAGDKLFIDYCGPTIPIVNPETGDVRRSQVFVATLGASNYTYVEASESQKLEHWLQCHANAFEHFGGVPALLVPDNLKAAVTKTDRYEPKLNDSYRQLAHHYQTAIMPARPYKPKDKAKAENAVLIVERWIMMRLRHRTFHTLRELNNAVRELMNALNQRPMQKIGVSRQALFDTLDKPALKPLPMQKYVYTEHKRAKVGPDYHIEYAKHYYSVPHQLVGQYVTLEATSQIIQIFHQGQPVSSHPISRKDYGLSTHMEHMPSHHQHQKWSPERLIGWSKQIGVATENVIKQQILSKAHPAQATRRCLGILSLARKHGDVRLEQACQDALLVNKPSLRFIRNLLDHHREGTLSLPSDSTPDIPHSNVRGPHCYH
jgi:transposase